MYTRHSRKRDCTECTYVHSYMHNKSRAAVISADSEQKRVTHIYHYLHTCIYYIDILRRMCLALQVCHTTRICTTVLQLDSTNPSADYRDDPSLFHEPIDNELIVIAE